MGHILVSVILAVIGGVITYALGYAAPWPYVVGVIVFLAYWGVSVWIVDGDW
jgi:membrane protein YdbS with pleckstrin-like domain